MARREEAVIDASVVVKWFSEEENTKSALLVRDEHIEGNRTLVAPDLLLYEIINALRFKPGFDKIKLHRALSDLFDIQIDLIIPHKDLMVRSSELAYLYDASLYDTCYLALAELMGIIVITSDKKFYEKVKESKLVKLV